MTEKKYLMILKNGVYLAFLPILFLFKEFFFPYISSKQLPFNILIEILFIFWVAFLAKYPDMRPKKSLVSLGLVLFFAVMVISGIFGVDFNMSFWGDVERLLGAFHILHFVVLYFIIITVFKTKEDWRNLFFVSVIFSLIVAIYGFFTQSFSMIGNDAYVGGYMLFNIYFALILARRSENKILKYSMSLAPIILAFSLIGTKVAGAYVGLAASIFLIPALYVFLGKEKRKRIFSGAVVFIFILAAILFFVGKNGDFVQGNSKLKMLADEMSFSKNTFQTRLVSWRAAWHGFYENPILGVGYGNYAIVFDKYFEPEFYNYTKSETYFDRAHNNLIDITATMGVIGLLSYLFIFAALLYYLIKNLKNKKLDNVEFILIVALIAGYFVQNLTVFDSFVTYFSLMIILAFVFWINHDDEGSVKKGEIKPWTMPLVLLLCALSVFSIFQYNIKSIRMIKGVISSQVMLMGKNFVGAMDNYRDVFNKESVLDRDGRSNFVRVVTSNNNVVKKLDKKVGGEIYDYAIRMMEKNLNYNFNDSLMQMQFAELLNSAADFYRGDKDKFSFYSNRAEEAINRSIDASPGRVNVYFIKAQVYLVRGDFNNAISTIEYAISLNKEYSDGYCYLAKIKMTAQKEDGMDIMNKCVDMGGAATLYPIELVQDLANYYASNEDYFRAISMAERLMALQSDSAQNWSNLAYLYLAVNMNEKAIIAAKKAAELDPALKSQAEAFVNSLSE